MHCSLIVYNTLAAYLDSYFFRPNNCLSFADLCHSCITLIDERRERDSDKERERIGEDRERKMERRKERRRDGKGRDLIRMRSVSFSLQFRCPALGNFLLCSIVSGVKS